MTHRQRLFSALLVVVTYVQSLPAMEFDFQPLSSLCRIEVNLSTGFGNKSISGTFGRLSGFFHFFPEKPESSNGKIVLASRSLRFGHPKVDYDTHAPDWLNSAEFPEISFHCNSLKDFSWHGTELRAEAEGVLSIKGIQKSISIPLSIRYLRGERRKYEGYPGDLLKIQGLLSISRSQFGIASGDFLSSVMENVEIEVSMIGVSQKVRPLLHSRLFLKNP